MPQFSRMIAPRPTTRAGHFALGVLLVAAASGGCRRETPDTVEVRPLSPSKTAAPLPSHPAPAAAEPAPAGPTVRVAEESSRAPAAATSAPDGLVRVPAGSVVIDGKRIQVDAFAIDRTEVTVEAYARCVAAKKCKPAASDDRACNWPARKKKGKYPINCVTVKQAKTFCEQNGQQLPTVAQWQLAAGGPEARPYPWGDALPSNIAAAEPVNGRFTPGPARHNLCWVGDSTDDAKYPTGTCPVGSYPSGNTPSGIADLAGNVAEWTSTSVTQAHGSVEFVIKGGGYDYDRLGRLEVGVADSLAFDDEFYVTDVGFRCVTAAGAR
jgi:formylglycine-generating enzyme required for sulfatase activity